MKTTIMNTTTTKSLPNFVYVSELLRTWETATLLFLSASNTNLTLHISPYLRESGPVPFPSDKPGDLKQQVREFVRFIGFLRHLKNILQNIKVMIPPSFVITLKHFGGPFNMNYIRGIETPKGVELSISREGGIEVKCNFANDTIPVTNSPSTLLLSNAIEVNTNPESNYVAYSETATTLKFPGASSGRNVGDMNTPSTPAGSLADFVKWCEDLTPKPHAEDIVYFVAHSGTMKTYVEQIEKLSPPPSVAFKNAYEQAVKTNTWSLFFKPNDTGAIFKGFRHAHSCDNRYMDKGAQTILTRLGEEGEYTNLSLWGILSTLKFSNKKVQSLINDSDVGSSKLKVCRGMDAEPSKYLGSTYDSVNELCGKQRDRMATNKFSIASGHCGTSDKSLFFNVTLNNDCIRIITDPNGPKVVLHLDKTRKAIDARFFESAKTSTKYYSAIALDSSNIRKSLKNVIELLLPTNTFSDNAHADADANANVDDLIKAVKLFIDNNPSYNSWKQPFTKLGLGAVDMSELKEFAPQPAVQAPVQAPVQVPVSVNGGATKKSRRRRKCAKIYTRRDKKYNSKRKSRQVRRRI